MIHSISAIFILLMLTSCFFNIDDSPSVHEEKQKEEWLKNDLPILDSIFILSGLDSVDWRNDAIKVLNPDPRAPSYYYKIEFHEKNLRKIVFPSSISELLAPWEVYLHANKLSKLPENIMAYDWNIVRLDDNFICAFTEKENQWISKFTQPDWIVYQNCEK